MPRGVFKHKPCTEERKEKARLASKKGEENWLWKGDKVKYRALHHWVKRWKGVAPNCEECGKLGEYIHMKNGYKRWNLDWSNIDKKYRRVLDDYIGRCRSCHKKYDLKVYKV